MNKLEKHIEKIAVAVDAWLQPDNNELQQAIERTVDENLFSFEDIRHQILTLKERLNRNSLQRWAASSNLVFNSLAKKKVLCLHAGNLPLVGIQDLLAVLMAGGTYAGKLSRKDPYLQATFLQKIIETEGFRKSVWSTKLDDLGNGHADALLFAGLPNSSESVLPKLLQLGLIGEETPTLMRTANFSVAYITDEKKETMQDLTEAVLRYGGKGCRSVAVVVAPFHLDSHKCSFTDYVETFWLQNPQHEKPGKVLEHRFAFNRALNIPQAWLNDFLIEETFEKPNENFVLHWIKGGYSTLKIIVEKYETGLQSVYSTAEFIGKKTGNYRIEPLSEAQSPPVWWKPDQIDTIEWLQNNTGNSIK